MMLRSEVLLILAVVLQFSYITPLKRDILPKGYEQINGTFYYISPEGIVFNSNDAVKICNDENMKLISYENGDKERMINYVLETKGYPGEYWTSGIRLVNSTFIWSGSGRLIQSYDNWNTQARQPDGTFDSGGCIAARGTDRMWWDDSCSMKYGVICEP